MKKYFLLLFLGITVTLNAQLIKIEGFPYAELKYTDWCAPAASQMVLKYKGINKTQCEIMDWVKSVNTSYGGPNGFGCCVDMAPGFEHPCHKPVPLGFFNEKGSVKDILMHFGTLNSKLISSSLWVDDIEVELTQNRPIIVQWSLLDGSGRAHVVVIYGIEKHDIIYYHDPTPWPNGGSDIKLSWTDFHYKENNHWWVGTLELLSDPEDPEDPDPEDPEEPEGPPCSNCKLDPGEENIDCGGDDCSPCDDVPKERNINNTAQLRKEVFAFKKITAGGNVVVQTGKNVSFITENEGSVVLKPGFKAENGSTFTTQRRDDISDCGRKCGKICKLDYVSPYVCAPDYLKIYQLIGAEQVNYSIYDKASNDKIYKNSINITSNDEIYVLWDGVIPGLGGYPEGTVSYIIEYVVSCCNNTSYTKRQEFSVNYFCYKSPGDDTEDPDDPAPFLSPPINSITLQEENTAPNFTIIPNPNPGTFQIETNFPLTDIAHLKITNMLGAPVYETQNLISNTIQLPYSASGQHFVIVILKDGTVLTQKMMLQR
jgi:hypothetical protein